MEQDSQPKSPRWTMSATPRAAILRGIIEAPSTPAIVLMATFIGFGALAREVGLDLPQAMFVSFMVWALPGQVVLADQIAQGATLAVATLAVTLTAIRLLPMVVSLMPWLRAGGTPKWRQLLMSHFIAVTVWIESVRRLPPLPAHLREPYYWGFAMTLLVVNTAATAFGFVMAAEVPRVLAAGLLFLTPIYFFLSMIAAAASRADIVALVVGAALGPVFFALVPGFDLIATGLVGGSIAYGVHRWRK